MKTLEVLSEDQVREQLEHGATLVTANRRLAGYCLGRYAEARQTRGDWAWETPDVLPYGTWLERFWQQVLAAWPQSAGRPPLLLSSHQQQLVWEGVLAESDAGKTLLHPEATARTVDDARRLCRQWHLPATDQTQWTGTDPAAFYDWASEFDRRLENNNWLDRHALAEEIRNALLNDYSSAPEVMVFYGFDDMTPQQAALIGALQDCGCRVAAQAFPERGGRAVRCGFADRQAEIAAAAAWARHRLKDFPGRRIGIVVPRLGDYRQTLIRVFDDVLDPGAVLSPQQPQARAYNISLGPPLSDYPVVQAAFDLLLMPAEALPVTGWTALLLSPFLAGAGQELSSRAAFDAWLKKNGEFSLSAGRMLQWIERFGQKGKQGRCPILYHHLQRFLQAFRQLPKRQAPAKWSRDFSGLLDAIGWPGQRRLNSHEYQAVSAWHEALSRFAALGDVCADLRFTDALNTLKRIVSQTPFQPESGDVAVQIMGMLEAGGEAFDDLWIMGMDQFTWPPPPQPNPFIPVHLQHRLELPHATPARELAYSRQLTRRLLCAADNVTVSYPLADGDSQCLPSPLIAHLPEISAEDFDGGGFVDFRRILADTAEIETLADDCAPALAVPEDVAGGTGVIKAQAACPFQAFARYRLGADALEMP
ncbi:MAG: PD-(D/E)XK nuclease family protein, partial [Thermodesulfobacteriota bacterium]